MTRDPQDAAKRSDLQAELLSALKIARDALLKATHGDEYSEFADELALIDRAIRKVEGGA